MNIKAMLASWQTTLSGILAFLCEATTLALLPDQYMQIGHSVCILLLACGVTVSKQQNVTNAAIPQAPTAVKVD